MPVTMELVQSYYTSRAPRVEGKKQKLQVTLNDLWIRDKSARLVNLGENVNPVQVKELDHSVPGWRVGDFSALMSKRIDILKPRQPGMSTLIQALMFCVTYNNEGFRGIIVAHKETDVERMFQRVRRFYDYLPPEKQRPLAKSSSMQLIYEDTDAGIEAATVGGKTVARSATFQLIHMSERAFWEITNANAVDADLMETLPDNGTAWIETTANGLGHYYDDYREHRHAESRWDARFFAWWEHPEYRRDATGLVPDDEELALITSFGVDYEQLAWRREKKAERKALFPQEYPAFWEEAFTASAVNAYFNIPFLQKMMIELQSPVHDPVAMLGPSAPDITHRTLRGDLEIWVPPSPGRKYTVLGDCAEGLDQKGVRYDKSEADIFDDVTWEQCGHYTGRPTPGDFARDLAMIAATWNGAELVVENNGKAGGAVLMALVKIEKYHNVYWTKEWDEKAFRFKERDPGYRLSTKTKKELDDTLVTVLSEMEEGLKGFILHSKTTVEQLMRYEHLPGGKAGAGGSAWDDAVSTLRLAGWRLLEKRPQPNKRPTSAPSIRHGASPFRRAM